MGNWILGFVLVGALQGGTTMGTPQAIFIRSVVHPELRDTLLIGTEGTVNLPLIGEIQLNTRDLKALKDTLNQLYRAYYTDPALDIIPLNLVFVFGAVRNPGRYFVPLPGTVVDALAMAGGPMPDANLKGTSLKRGTDVQRINLDAMVKGKAAPVPLQSGDILYIPTKTFILRFTNVQGLVVLLSLIWNIYLTLWVRR